MTSQKRFDFVIFGASGFTGEYVVEEVALTAGDSVKWAVAGRSKEKLEKTLDKVSQWTGLKLQNTPVIIADTSDANSLAAMAKQAGIVINCVGPYHFFGDAVVKACVENGANHLDISGEIQFLEAMQVKYDERAKQAGVYVVGACGFGSIPAEMGLNLARKLIEPGELNVAEAFAATAHDDQFQGHEGNFGSYQSIIYAIANRHDLKTLRRELFKERLPKPTFKLPRRKPLFYHDGVGGWCLPYPGMDKSVMYRSQYYNYVERHLRPVAVNTYIKCKSLWTALALILWAIVFSTLANFAFGRKLLEKYPRIFTFGQFDSKGPPRDQLKFIHFSYWLFANGWSTKLANPNEAHTSKPDRQIVIRVDGPDTGYFGTAACFVACALTMLDQPDRLPKEGGVYTPGVMFAETNLVEKMNKRGVVTFTVVDGPKAISKL